MILVTGAGERSADEMLELINERQSTQIVGRVIVIDPALGDGDSSVVGIYHETELIDLVELRRRYDPPLARIDRMLDEFRQYVEPIRRLCLDKPKNWRWFHTFKPSGNLLLSKVLEELPVFVRACARGGQSMAERRRWKRRRAVQALQVCA